LHHCDTLPLAVKEVLSLLMTLTILLGVCFLGLMVGWIADQDFNKLDQDTTLGWIIYDWLNALICMAYAAVVIAITKWEHEDKHEH
jgi:hypothetical protein